MPSPFTRTAAPAPPAAGVDDLTPEEQAEVDERYRRAGQHVACNHGQGGPACHCTPEIGGPAHPNCPVCFEWRYQRPYSFEGRSSMPVTFEHQPHPRIAARKKAGAAKTRDEHVGLHGKITLALDPGPSQGPGRRDQHPARQARAARGSARSGVTTRATEWSYAPGTTSAAYRPAVGTTPRSPAAPAQRSGASSIRAVAPASQPYRRRPLLGHESLQPGVRLGCRARL